MDFQAILTLIISIITMLMQIFNPAPAPTPVPTPAAFEAMSHVNCNEPQWAEVPSAGNVYVQGSLVKDCVVKLDAINLSSDDAVDRMTASLLVALENNSANIASDESYELSSEMKRNFSNSQVLNVQGQQVPVSGKVSLVSDHSRALTTQYTTEKLPTKGDASFLKAMQSSTQVQQSKSDPTKFLVRVTNTSQVLRPWYANASKFKAMYLEQLKARLSQHASQTITNLVNGLQ